jgi:hypothetical protein
MSNKSNESRRSYGFRGHHTAYVFLSLAAILLAGCGIGSERKAPLEMKARDLEREKAQLAGQLEQRQVEIEQLKTQVKTLAALPPEKQQDLFALSSVKITRFTGFYDKDEDGKREKLIVYLQPVDQAGDVVKVPGIASVQLWNLNNPDGQALLGQWQVRPEEIGKLWFSTLTSPSFRLTFDLAVTAELLAVPLTVKSTFTDCLTGKTSTDQFVIQPRNAAAKQ